MDWISGIGRALEYIEEHITEPIDYEAVAKCSYSSSFHFQRVFSVICGYTVGDYVRQRRLALAAVELATEDRKVLDVALKYGYDTSESFSRAFTKFHGVTPTQAKNGATVKSYSKLSIKLSISGGTKMDYRFEKKEAYDVLVKKERFNTNKEICEKEIQSFWGRCREDGTIDRICKYVNENNMFHDSLIGIGIDQMVGAEDFVYGIGCHYNGMPVTDDNFTVMTIQPSEYVVFPCRGKMPEAFESVYKYIFEEFFPNSDYQPSGIEIEAYPSADIEDEEYCWELWLSIKKK